MIWQSLIECGMSHISVYFPVQQRHKTKSLMCLSATVQDCVIRGIYIMHDCIPIEQPLSWASISAGCLLSSYGSVSGQLRSRVSFIG